MCKSSTHRKIEKLLRISAVGSIKREFMVNFRERKSGMARICSLYIVV
jgi:hypothetical protein